MSEVDMKGAAMVLMTGQQVAAYFGVSDVTVARWRKTGILEGTKIARSYYYDRAKVEAMVATECGTIPFDYFMKEGDE
jgi:hypothetical protein